MPPSDEGDLVVLDTTLRDGAQGEGISFSVADKLRVAEALDELGVALIEAGNPSSNPKDAEFFRAARGLRLRGSELAAFGATRRRGLAARDDPGLASLLSAGTGTVVVFGKAWDFHVERVLGASLAENLDMIAETVAYLRAEGRRVVFDAEHFFDGYAAAPDYALACLRAAAEAGAAWLALCDTNGGRLPEDVEAGVVAANSVVARGAGPGLGIHAHNDSGLAVANSLAAVRAGARMVQGTLAGFGERCGNANLSTLIGCLELKLGRRCLAGGSGPAGLSTAVRRVAEAANVTLDEGLPFVGQRAFAHKAGMHVDAVLKAPASFEHVTPDSVGNGRRFLASEVGGRSVLAERMASLRPGLRKDDPLVALALDRLKALEGRGYQFEGADASLELLLRKASGEYRPYFELERYRTAGERGREAPRSASGDAYAMVQLTVGGQRELQAAQGDGPVHALDLALRRALDRFYPSLRGMALADYKVRVIDGSSGTQAGVRVLIESRDAGAAWTTVGVSTDIIEASWLALVDSIEYKLARDGVAAPEPVSADDAAEAMVARAV